MTRAAFAMAVAAVAAALSGCTKAEEEYSDEPCYFVFDNSVHQDATLASAMSAMSPGVFCHISETERSGATFFEFENNHGLSSEKRANAVDQQRSRRLGRRNGIIVGYGNGDITNPVFYAYDAQCPVCYTGTGLVDRTHDSHGDRGQRLRLERVDKRGHPRQRRHARSQRVRLLRKPDLCQNSARSEIPRRGCILWLQTSYGNAANRTARRHFGDRREPFGRDTGLYQCCR